MKLVRILNICKIKTKKIIFYCKHQRSIPLQIKTEHHSDCQYIVGKVLEDAKLIRRTELGEGGKALAELDCPADVHFRHLEALRQTGGHEDVRAGGLIDEGGHCPSHKGNLLQLKGGQFGGGGVFGAFRTLSFQ